MRAQLRNARPALLGKAPCKPDFIRIQADAPEIQAFHRWLEASVETLGATGARLPDEPIRFFHLEPGSAVALAGVMAKSQDQVGRAFPLSVLLPLEAAPLARDFAAVPLALRGWFEQASALLAGSENLDVNGLSEQLEALPPVDEPKIIRASEAAASAVRSASAADLRALFEAGGEAYAVRTFLMACETERKGKPVKGEPVALECPVSERLGPWAWLDLAARRARWRSPPSFIWSSSKLLLTLGPVGASALVWFCKESPDAVKLWPLRTTSADAVSSAQAALGALRDDLARDSTALEVVWSALERMP